MDLIRIIGWSKFQHYKNRNPPWIKLHRELLTSQTWVSCDDASRVLAVALMLLAAATDNKIPADPKYLQRVAYLKRPPNLQPLIDVHFIEYIGRASIPLATASNLQATCASTEKETEQRQRAETEKTDTVRLAFGEFGNVRLSDVELGKLKAKLDGKLGGLIDRLDRWGAEEPGKFKKKKSHYATILNWAARDEGGNGNGSRRNQPIRETDHEKNKRAGQEFLDREMAREMRSDISDVRENSRRLPGKV